MSAVAEKTRVTDPKVDTAAKEKLITALKDNGVFINKHDIADIYDFIDFPEPKITELEIFNILNNLKKNLLINSLSFIKTFKTICLVNDHLLIHR